MSNESVGCLTCGNKHLKTTCVDTYLAEVHKGCCWGGADILLILISFCVNENGVKAMKGPLGRLDRRDDIIHRFDTALFVYGCFTAANMNG